MWSPRNLIYSSHVTGIITPRPKAHCCDAAGNWRLTSRQPSFLQSLTPVPIARGALRIVDRMVSGVTSRGRSDGSGGGGCGRRGLRQRTMRQWKRRVAAIASSKLAPAAYCRGTEVLALRGEWRAPSCLFVPAAMMVTVRIRLAGELLLEQPVSNTYLKIQNDRNRSNALIMSPLVVGGLTRRADPRFRGQ